MLIIKNLKTTLTGFLWNQYSEWPLSVFFQ